MSFQMRPLACCILIGFGLISCQRYQAKPLALQERLHTWSQQDRNWLEHNLPENKRNNQFNLDDGIQLAEAEAISLFYNQSLRITRLQAISAGVGIKHARTWDDPELGIDADYILENVDQPLSSTFSIGISIPLSGRKSAAQQLASASYNQAEQAVIVAEWTLLQSLRQAWCDAAASKQQLQLSNNLIAEIKTLSSQTRALLDAQMISINDAQLLQIGLAQQQQLSLQLQDTLQQQQQVILQLLGLHPDATWDLDIELPTAPLLNLADTNSDADTSADITDAVLNTSHPVLRLHSLAYVVAEQQLALEIRKQYPDLQFGFGAGREDGAAKLVFGLGLLPIPIWNRNTGEIAQATSQREEIAAQAQQALQTLIYRQHGLRQRLQIQGQLISHLNESLIPVIKQQLYSSQRLFQQGSGNVFHVIDALRSLSEAQSEYIRAIHQQRHQQLELAGIALPLAEASGSTDSAAPTQAISPTLSNTQEQK